MRAGSARASLSTGWALALVLAATAWLYAPALRTAFFADDFLFLDQVRSRSLIESLQVPDPLSNFFRPVSRQLYFWIVAGLTHESPVAFRVGNLAFLLVALVLLFALARRLAGARAGLIAAGILALHYAPDVPVRWACGSQELLAVVGAMGALLLHLSGRRLWAAVALLLAALSKEVILLAPVIAIVADRRPDEPWRAAARRAWPLGAAVVAWGLIWLLMPHTRAAQSTEVEFDVVKSPLAAFAHLPEVVLGAEWRQGEFGRLPRVLPPLVPLIAVLAAVAAAWGKRARGEKGAAGAESERMASAAGQEGAGETAGGGRRARQQAGRGAAAHRAQRRNRRAQRSSPAVGTAGPHPVAAQRPATDRSARHALLVGVVWAVVGTIPVAAVAILWSAYYYLFAMCGVSLALAVWLARKPMAWSLAAIVVLAWGSASARSLDEFSVARDPWAPQSHINRHYIERSNRIVAGYLASLQRAYPAFPKESTLFFAGLKGNVAFQRANGPLVRWAYRDSSLRSYYLTSFTREKARRGPLYFFLTSGDTLREMARGPGMLLRLAFAMIVSDQPKSARDCLALELERDPQSPTADYWFAWTQWALGDTAAAIGSLGRAGVSLERGAAEERPRALAALAAGDTAEATRLMGAAVMRRTFDPAAHALLADLILMGPNRYPDGGIEAYAARVLSPHDPYAWRRWGMIQTDRERYLEALNSFERYFALGGPPAAGDAEARHWVASIRAMLPGGNLAPEELRQ